MENMFKLILEKLDSMEKRFERKFEQIDKRFDTFEAKQKRQGDLLHQLINSVAATNVKLSETNE